MTQDHSSNPLHHLSNQLADVVEQAAPSVVRVDDGSRLTATGLIWTGDGLIVTTSHGVERDENLVVEQGDGRRLPALVVGRDPDTDVALLRVQASDLPAMPRAEPNEVRVGQLTLALARPGESGLQTTLGIVSARVESQNRGRDEYILHTDALLYPGFSGGALVNAQGALIGMTNLLFGRGKSIALGLPIIANVAEALLKTGRVQRGYLGISTQQVAIPESLQKGLKLEQERGLLIVQVEVGSGAEQGGLFIGDTVLKLNGQSVSDVDALRQHLRGQQAGNTLDLQILRGGELRDVQVTLGVQK